MLDLSFITPFLKEESFLSALEAQSEAVLWLSAQFTLVSNGRLRPATKEESSEHERFETKLRNVIHPAGLFASWLLTWFTHDFEDCKEIFPFACGLQSSTAPVYLSAALLILNAPRLQLPSVEPFDLVIQIRKLPRGTTSKKLINCTKRLFALFPPGRLFLHFPHLQVRNQSYRTTLVFSASFLIKLSLLMLLYILVFLVNNKLKSS